MIKLRPAQDRGKAEFGGLESYHSFSFGDYYDPNYMGFRALRVINQDVLQGGVGFPPHPHRDMEIVTYVLDGALEHADSMGNKEVIRAGEVQRMTAGKGVTHSEYNQSKTDPVHLLQIWIVPEKRGLEPGYEQKEIGPALPGFKKIAGQDAENGAVHINQSATIYEGNVEQGKTVELPVDAQRFGWLQLISGAVKVGEVTAKPGDGIMISDENRPTLSAEADSKMLFFDLA